MFTGYSTEAGKAIHSNDILEFQSKVDLLNNYQQNISNSPEEIEIHEQLNLTIEVPTLSCYFSLYHSNYILHQFSSSSSFHFF